MRAREKLGFAAVGALAAVFCAYAASPFVAMWLMADSLRAGDTRALASHIDWNAVRAGLKEDIAEGVMGDLAPSEPAPGAPMRATTISSDSPVKLAANSLPPFGASFFTGIAGSVVDREVTPEHLAAMARQLAPAGRAESGSEASGASLPIGQIRNAYFDGLASFELSVLCPGQDAGDEPLRLRLALRQTGWTVVRAWVPQDLVDLANSRT